MEVRLTKGYTPNTKTYKTLYKWLLKNYAKEGDTILDTPTLEAVQECIAAMDISSLQALNWMRYYEAAKEESYTTQQNLF